MSDLTKIAKKIVASEKGILAADWSTGTIKKHFAKVGLESTPELNRQYRQMLLTTPGIEKFIGGVIFFDETVWQKTDDGIPFPKLLSDRGITPGIKVDQSIEPFPGSPKEKVTKGIESLKECLLKYKKMDLKFTKWRAVITIGEGIPTEENIKENSRTMAEYAKVSQDHGFVPVVEPEVVTEGDHDIQKCEEVTYKTLKEVFYQLSKKGVNLEEMLLKPNWVHPGRDFPTKPKSEDVAKATIRVFKEVVPSEVPGIVFLSGGDSPEDSTDHLNALDKEGRDFPWEISFSFARALQKEALKAWALKKGDVEFAQKVFYKRAKLVFLAGKGKLK